MFEDMGIFDLNITQDIHILKHHMAPLLGCTVVTILFIRKK